MKLEQLNAGYAIWLEPTYLHFHHGDNAEVKLCWGYAMVKETIDKPMNFKGCVINPEGENIPAQILKAEEDLHYKLVFNGKQEGLYTVQVESEVLFNNAAGEEIDNGYSTGLCFKQLARIIVPIGHHVYGKGIALKKGIEIVTGEYSQFHPEDEIELTVLDEGKPVARAQVEATYHLYEGGGFKNILTADDNGKVRFTFNARGHWMFQTQTGKGSIMNVFTLVIPGVR